MRTNILLAFAIASSALLGACNWGETIDQYPCPSAGTKLTWKNFGQSFFEQWCDRCHSAEEGDRNGAPGVDVFETDDQVKQLKDRIFLRAADTNDSMPPGPDDPPLATRKDLAEWLACGAPE